MLIIVAELIDYIFRADSRFAPAYERQRYFVTMSLIGWAQT